MLPAHHLNGSVTRNFANSTFVASGSSFFAGEVEGTSDIHEAAGASLGPGGPGGALGLDLYPSVSTSGQTMVIQPSGPNVMTRSPRAAAWAISGESSMSSLNSAEPTNTSVASTSGS